MPTNSDDFIRAQTNLTSRRPRNPGLHTVRSLGKVITERRVYRSPTYLARSLLAVALLWSAGSECAFALQTASPELCEHLSRAGVVGGCGSGGSASSTGAGGAPPAENPIEQQLPQGFPKVKESGLPQAQDWNPGFNEDYPVREEKPNFDDRAVRACNKKKTPEEREHCLDNLP